MSQSEMSYIIVKDVLYLRVGYASSDKGGGRPCRSMLLGEVYGSISRGAVTGSMSAMLKVVVYGGLSVHISGFYVT